MNSSKKKDVGNKAGRLLVLKKNGFLVPSFKVISSDFFSRLSKFLNLARLIKDEEENNNDIKTIVQLSQRIEKKFLTNESKNIINKHLSDFLLSCDLMLSNDGQLIVRSSSSLEDSSNKTAAGFHKSVVVKNKNSLTEAILAVMASLYSPQALAAISKQELAKAKMAVIVQELVKAKFSGVLLTDERGHLVVSVKTESNVSITDGSSEDDEQVFKLPLLGLKKDLNSHIHKALFDNFIFFPDLINQSLAIERLFGKPQNIEFAVDDGGKIFFLQSRDITF